MPASKIQNEREILDWFEEGKTYAEMCDIYRTKYNIEVVPSLFGNFRRRRGLPRRIARNDDLIPWAIAEKHVTAYPLAMLRVESRLREGLPLRQTDEERVSSWKAMLEEGNLVVHYDPDTDAGFYYVPRERGDDDLIHKPRVKTTTRLRAD